MEIRRRRFFALTLLPLTETSTETFSGAVISTLTDAVSGRGGIGGATPAGLIHFARFSVEPLNLLRSTLVSSMPQALLALPQASDQPRIHRQENGSGLRR
jgi:hypothetical protein